MDKYPTLIFGTYVSIYCISEYLSLIIFLNARLLPFSLPEIFIYYSTPLAQLLTFPGFFNNYSDFLVNIILKLLSINNINKISTNKTVLMFIS